MIPTSRRAAAGALSAMCLLAAGCGGSLPTQVVVPKDPTPLAKCKVAASKASPLVTEWPASEKARLEGLLSEGGVAVAYSGCEMSILDRCKIEGSYGFQRTTPSTDTVEITDADELYAKLPLGAVSLEGELSRSGRLAIRTTVAGQVKFKGDPAGVPSGGACTNATHVVTGISVGAFKMLSGGAVSGGGGISVAGAGAGGKVSRAEEVMRQAGSPDQCAEATAEAAHPDCNSPIQVFLTPVLKKPGDPGYVEPEEDTRPPPNAVRMSFAAPPAGNWTLQEESGQSLCQLPCSRWIVRDKTYLLQLDTDSGVQKIKMPRVEYAPGQKVDVQVLEPRGSKGLGIAATITGGVGMVAGAAMAFLAGASEEEGLLVPGLAVIGGGAALLTTGIVVLAYSRGYKPEFRLSSPGDAAALEPHIVFGPGSARGAF